MPPVLLFASLLAAAPVTASADSTVYPVINHDRIAGSMVVTHRGDTVTVRYVFTDRNRGSRTFVRYLTQGGRIVSTEVRPVLANESLGELYERAGIPAETVLQMATIVSARVMKDDKDYGSVAEGKVADLFIVNGKPTERVSDVRKVEQVMRGGGLFDAATLRRVVLCEGSSPSC